MRFEGQEATGLDAAGPMAKIRNHQEAYTRSLPKSSGNLKEQVGLLLLRLQSPLSREQRSAGYQLLEVLLSVRYAGGIQ